MVRFPACKGQVKPGGFGARKSGSFRHVFSFDWGVGVASVSPKWGRCTARYRLKLGVYSEGGISTRPCLTAYTAAWIRFCRCSLARMFARYVLTVFSVIKRSTARSEEHTSELQSRPHLVCRL